MHRQNPECRLLLVAELQAEPDADMLERLGEYSFRLRRELRHDTGQAGKYPVLCLVLNLTGAEQSRELAMTVDGWDEANLVLRVAQGTLRAEAAAATLARIARRELDRWVLPWLPLLRGAAEDANLAEWLRLAALEPNERDRAEMAALALVFADLADSLATWQTAMRSLNMQTSVVVEGWKTEGAIEYARQNLLRAVVLRFGATAPPEVILRIQETTDLNTLKSWFDASQTANSLGSFRAATGL